jgi:hypothetical protein
MMVDEVEVGSAKLPTLKQHRDASCQVSGGATRRSELMAAISDLQQSETIFSSPTSTGSGSGTRDLTLDTFVRIQCERATGTGYSRHASVLKSTTTICCRSVAGMCCTYLRRAARFAAPHGPELMPQLCSHSTL